jgi:hypothetical protein
VPTSAINTIWNVAKNALTLAENVQKPAKCKIVINSKLNNYQKKFSIVLKK